MNLNEEQIERFSRHIILQNVGGSGQEKIINSKVLVVGAGGLGAPILLYLAAAGIGTLGIIDGDVVDLSNLQRQVTHFTKDIGVAKVNSAKEKVLAINPDIQVNTYQELFTADNGLDLIKGYDFIIDGTDNFPAKFMVNDTCVIGKKPYSHAGILRFDGQTMTYTPGSACYRCVFKEPPPKNAVPTCSQAGVLGAIAGIIGSTQATEALKYIIGTGELLTNRMMIMDALRMKFRTVSFKRNSNCAVCGDSPSITKPFYIEQPICELKQARS